MVAKLFNKTYGWNHKKTERLYAKLKLAKLRKKRLRRLVQVKEPLMQPLAASVLEHGLHERQLNGRYQAARTQCD